MKYVLSVDWFQCFCRATDPIDFPIGSYIQGKRPGPMGYTPMYQVKDCREKHPLYIKSMTLALKGWDLLHIHWCPRSSVIAKNAVAVKVANRALYHEHWPWHIRNVMALLKLKYEGLTRVDICMDFQLFSGDLEPRTFIARYLADGSVSDGVQYIRKGSNQYFVAGRKRHTPLCACERNQGGDESLRTLSCHEYLRFGTRRSGVSAYLYNKSLELAESGKKKYIREMWEQNQLISRPDLPVFRLEFSIQSKGMTCETYAGHEPLKQLGLKNLSVLSIEDFASYHRLQDVFFSYAGKYWNFRQVTNVKYVKDMPTVQLFDIDFTPTLLPRDISRTLDTGRSERNAAICLERLARDLPDLNTTDAQKLYDASGVLLSLGLMKDVVFRETIPDEGYLFRPKTLPYQQLLRNYRCRPVQEDHLARLCSAYIARKAEEIREECWKEIEDVRQNAQVVIAAEHRDIRDDDDLSRIIVCPF